MTQRISRQSGTVPFGGSRELGDIPPQAGSPLQRKQEVTTAASPAPHDEIARVAYELFEWRGRRPGCDLEDWLEAERIVRERHRTRSAQ